MHPIEHLRHVARATGADPALVATEAASALGHMAEMDPAGLVPACRRLVERHLTSGPVWWMAARILTADDQRRAARESAGILVHDRTAQQVAAALPDSSSVLIIGWPDLAAEALRIRGDVEALVVDADGEGAALARRLQDGGGESSAVPEAGAGAAAAVADLVLLEAHAGGPSGVLTTPGSLGAAAVAAQLGVPVWAVTGVGRILPERLWNALLNRFDETAGEPWSRPSELVPASFLSAIVGPEGLTSVAEGLGAATCPTAPELLRSTA
jgi:hypothetical protein